MKALRSLIFFAVAAALIPVGARAATREELLADGERYLLMDNALLAERAFVVGADTWPDDPRFPYYGGIAAYLQGRNADAVRRLEQAREAFPKANFFLGLIAIEDDRPQDAVAWLDLYLEQFPRDPEAELLKGIALAAVDNPDSVQHLNLAAQLKAELRSHALIFRGITQVKARELQSADKALRAVQRLNDRPALVSLSEQALDVAKNRGDVGKLGWGEAYVDVVYDDNVGRDFDRNPRNSGFRTLLRGRYWRDLLGQNPRLTLGGFLDHDQPTESSVVAQTSLGALADLGFYRALRRISLDPGVELDPNLTLGDVHGVYGASQFELLVRPRLYLFADHERATKVFYEIGFRSDLVNGFLSGPVHRLGVRPSWTGANRRTYVSGLIALESFRAATPAYRTLGPHLGLDGQALVWKGFLVEAAANYRKLFYRDVDPARTEDVLSSHGGIGWWHAKSRLVALAGGDQEHHLNSERDRNWRVRSYWLRLGAYF